MVANDDDRHGLRLVDKALHWPAEKLNPPPLLSGDDLKELGIPAGPRYREILQHLRDAQLNGEIQTRAAAVQWVQTDGDSASSAVN